MPADRRLRVVVTGATAGLGYFAAERLAALGHQVVLAARSPERAVRAADTVRDRVPGADVSTVDLDLADLSSVRSGADALTAAGGVDALLANAGVVGSRRRQTTADGFELQFGTNHLGHFALVSHLLPALAESPRGRVVHLGSISHRFVRLDLDDPMMVSSYSGAVAYARSKLAVMTFGLELDRRLRAAGSSVSSVIAHPGLSWESLSDPRPPVVEPRRPPAVVTSAMHAFSQGKEAGAEPLVHATVDPGVRGGEYWGPSGWFQLTGPPAVVPTKKHARDRASAERLWAVSAELTHTDPVL
ncbi:SDR family NAD(P)-dependent oxidoreductase [Frigoribacterium sp. VKM Ac-2530]|uniref:SDR family NAD(P)-dependent oxidoreductase n=1 Tax=Frigoribacterium sp. VKM Ac-2530 TaxID=2783822 RepID=UPI00188BED28|nr:SDR family NAD(P)-dependent oxidoreductase [Frigoribacterium sp. VKM Ac-2530]MBF4578249.1 SDR family NAD(P)-dependent oxidoreductase [Frigoribacterium sp. VKM Ac-2530]